MLIKVTNQSATIIICSNQILKLKKCIDENKVGHLGYINDKYTHIYNILTCCITIVEKEYVLRELVIYLGLDKLIKCNMICI